MIIMSPTKGEGNILFLAHRRLSDIFLCAQYLMNRLVDFNQICMDIISGHREELIRF